MAKRSGTSSSGARSFSGGGGGGNGLAQSGGINHTFGGGKGGTAKLKADTTQRKIGGGTLNNGLKYTTRTEGGNASLSPETFRVGSPPPVQGGSPVSKLKKVSVRKPQTRGGSK